MMQMIERAMDHQGFSVIECLSECVEFFPDVFDPANPKKGRQLRTDQEKKLDNTPEDELRHDVTDEVAAYKLASASIPRRVRCVLAKPIAQRRTLWRRSGLRIHEKRLATPAISKSSRKPLTE